MFGSSTKYALNVAVERNILADNVEVPVLSECYPCNNAKSDVFTFRDFRKIGKTIGKIKGLPKKKYLPSSKHTIKSSA